MDNAFIGIVISVVKPFPIPFWNVFNGKAVVLSRQVTFLRSGLHHRLVLTTMPEFQLISTAALG